VKCEGQVSVELEGVPETLLWTLYHRATEARRPDAVLRDPKAVEPPNVVKLETLRLPPGRGPLFGYVVPGAQPPAPAARRAALDHARAAGA
jgi:hypothetical protein